MTEVLSFKHYGNDGQDMDFAPRQSTSVITYPDNIIGSSSSAFVIQSPVLEDRATESSDINRDRLLREHSVDGAERSAESIAKTEREQAQLSLLALLLSAFRRSGLTCHGPQEEIKMDIGWPTKVRHVAHVTFDRFNGFLGLPVEFEMQIPRRVPSASASVFGVSAESMQCSYDKKGNCVPTILLLLQERLYQQGGLQAEGLFRINPENSQEEDVRDQLNKGIVPHDIDVHCLAGLIKAWFRELPTGVLDSLSPDQVMQCHTEEQSLELVKLLPPMQAALLDWTVNLMTDVVQEEALNKMNARNIAMVFAPNMTQMSDPLTALMHAVQVMNFLKTLILKTLRDREAAVLDPKIADPCAEPPNGNGQGNATKGLDLGISSEWDQTDNGQPNSSTELLLKGSLEKESVIEEASVEIAEEKLLRGSSVKETIHEDKLSHDSRCPISNGLSAADNIDSNEVEAGTNNAHKKVSHGSKQREVEMAKYPVRGDSEKVGTNGAAFAFGKKKGKSPGKGSTRKGRTGIPNPESEQNDNKDFLQYGVIGISTTRGKTGGRLVARFDQQNEKVEAW